MRDHQGADTLWAMADLKWGFDLADIPGMLVAAYCAGLTGVDWLLLDDMLTMDSQRATLHGLLSAPFVLGRGRRRGAGSASMSSTGF